ncbi:MAG: Resolvase helix-turn-helix protein [Parcubacteria group bacterium Gr01-1014_29]|nr:MAG: Resolvase helix-turn-helix protein [Parcubacteria group bacterium Gr01-1014_29]
MEVSPSSPSFSIYISIESPKDLGLRSTTELPRHGYIIHNKEGLHKSNLLYNENMGSVVRKDYEEAFKLRLVGRSYSEINSLLGIPKSTLSGWFSGLELSDKANDRLRKRVYTKSIVALIRRNKNQTHIAIQRMRKIRSAARKEIMSISRKELKLIGIALYWAEGYKMTKKVHGREVTNHPVSFVNSDPALISLFLRFLRDICKVEENRITASIRIYEHMNEKELLRFWCKITNVPLEKFQKTYYGVSKSSQHKRPFNRLQYGTLAVRVNDTNLFHKIIGWINGLASV